MIYYVVFFQLISTAFAHNLNELIRSQNLEELLRAEAVFQQTHKMKLACGVEQKKLWFPYHCLKILDQEMMQRQASPRLLKQIQQINQLCIKNYKSLSEEVLLTELLNLQTLPQPCRKVLEIQKGDLDYVRSSD